jgi:hypothetical protein
VPTPQLDSPPPPCFFGGPAFGGPFGATFGGFAVAVADDDGAGGAVSAGAGAAVSAGAATAGVGVDVSAAGAGGAVGAEVSADGVFDAPHPDAEQLACAPDAAAGGVTSFALMLLASPPHPPRIALVPSAQRVPASFSNVRFGRIRFSSDTSQYALGPSPVSQDSVARGVTSTAWL